MFNEIAEIKGSKKGPISIILAGVHGDERCGIDAMDEVLPNLKIEKGRVFFGYGNPRATVTQKRFIQKNLNRMFQPNSKLTKEEINSYEYQRARKLMPYLKKAGALLDLHGFKERDGKPFAICERRSINIASFLPVKTLVSGFDKVQPGGTDYFMNKSGKIGICLECGDRNGPKARRLAKKAIIDFLTARGHVNGDIKKYQQEKIKVYYQYLSKTNNFKISREFKNFQKIKKGQLIGHDGQDPVVASEDCRILFPGNRSNKGDEAFLLAK